MESFSTGWVTAMVEMPDVLTDVLVDTIILASSYLFSVISTANGNCMLNIPKPVARMGSLRV